MSPFFLYNNTTVLTVSLESRSSGGRAPIPYPYLANDITALQLVDHFYAANHLTKCSVPAIKLWLR